MILAGKVPSGISVKISRPYLGIARDPRLSDVCGMRKQTSDSDFVSVPEAAARIRLSTRQFNRLVAAGEIQKTQLSARRVGVHVGELERYLATRPTIGRGEPTLRASTLAHWPVRLESQPTQTTLDGIERNLNARFPGIMVVPDCTDEQPGIVLMWLHSLGYEPDAIDAYVRSLMPQPAKAKAKGRR